MTFIARTIELGGDGWELYRQEGTATEYPTKYIARAILTTAMFIGKTHIGICEEKQTSIKYAQGLPRFNTQYHTNRICH